MSVFATTRRGRATTVALLAVVCSAFAAPGARADLASPIRAVFLKEFSKAAYTMNRGQLLVFENDDPFLVHGIGGSLIASAADPGKTRLVRNSPYLPAGSYPFADPLHPEMSATLTITGTGTFPPPDTTPPAAKVKILPGPAKKVATSGRVRVRVTPTEAADVDVTLLIGNKKVAKNSAAFAEPVGRVIPLLLAGPARKLARAGAVVTVRVKLADVTGKPGGKRVTARLGGGGGKR